MVTDYFLLRQRLSNRRQDFVLGRESEGSLLSHLRLSHPHGELAPAAGHELGLDASFLLDQRRHTGSARKVVSNLAVANAHALHRIGSSGGYFFAGTPNSPSFATTSSPAVAGLTCFSMA